MNFDFEHTVNQKIKISEDAKVSLFLKREDQLHAFVSGNKYRKLKYNLLEADKHGKKTILTFGGAYSNHIAAVASAGNILGFNTIGIIRGEELVSGVNNNPTLHFAKENGMQFKFVTRSAYRNKTDLAFINNLKEEFGDFHLVPEGGTNALAVKGCEEILRASDNVFDFICCPIGTGGTISGLINASVSSQKVLGFPALKGSFLHKDISRFVSRTNWELIENYHFGGYAKVDENLINFINKFKSKTKVLIDPIYTGKMLYGIYDLIDKNYFPEGSKILAIHTGGLQGIIGMNMHLKNKNMPLIQM